MPLEMGQTVAKDDPAVEGGGAPPVDGQTSLDWQSHGDQWWKWLHGGGGPEEFWPLARRFPLFVPAWTSSARKCIGFTPGALPKFLMRDLSAALNGRTMHLAAGRVEIAAYVMPALLMPRRIPWPGSATTARFDQLMSPYIARINSGAAALKTLTAVAAAEKSSKLGRRDHMGKTGVMKAISDALYVGRPAVDRADHMDICVLVLWCHAMAEVMSPFSSVPTRRVNALAAVALMDMAPSPAIVAEMRRHNVGLLSAVAVPPRRPRAGALHMPPPPMPLTQALRPQKGRIRSEGVDEVFLAVASVMDVFLDDSRARSETETAIEAAFAELLAISPAGQRVWATFPLERRVELCCQLLQSTVATLSAAAFDRFVLPAVVVPLAAIVDFGSAAPQAPLVSHQLARRVEFLFRTPQIASFLAAGGVTGRAAADLRASLTTFVTPLSARGATESQRLVVGDGGWAPQVPPLVTINFLLRCRFPFDITHTILCHAFVIVPVPQFHRILGTGRQQQCGHDWCELINATTLTGRAAAPPPPEYSDRENLCCLCVDRRANKTIHEEYVDGVGTTRLTLPFYHRYCARCRHFYASTEGAALSSVEGRPAEELAALNHWQSSIAASAKARR